MSRARCGFTPQYAGLEGLHRRYRDHGFAVLGFPCDQFGHQEPGDEAAIQELLHREIRRDVSDVREDRGQWRERSSVIQSSQTGSAGLLGHAGDQVELHQVPGCWESGVVRRYAPTDKPQALAEDIEAALG